MNLYLSLILWAVLLIIGIGLLFWALLIRTRIDRKLNMRDALLSSDQLEGHAKTTAAEHSVRKRHSYLNWPVLWMNQNYEIILSVYKSLNSDIQKKLTVPPAAEWLMDNFYIIEEQVKSIRRDLDLKSYFKLPVLKSGFLKGYARIFAVSVEIIMHTDGQINESVVLEYLKAYQSHNILFEREIWALPLVIRLALIDNIKHQCKKIENTIAYWRKADKVFEEWLSTECTDADCVMKAYRESLESTKEINASFLEQLFYLLRRSGNNYSDITRDMDDYHSKLGLTTKQIIQQEHNTRSVNTVTMGNCISSLRLIATLDWGELLDSVSLVEKILRSDPDATYPIMDLKTRNYYRSRVEILASIYGVSELFISKEAIRLAEEAYAEHQGNTGNDNGIQRTFHVGYYLVDKGIKVLESQQKKRNKFLPAAAIIVKKHPELMYVLPIGLITAVLVALAVMFSIVYSEANTFLISILAGLAVLIPSSEIAIVAINRIICRTLPPAIFPRLELKNGIPAEYSTIVAIPTLLPDVKRVRELVHSLENHFLTNKEDNLYFALIGAFRDADKKDMSDDSDIIDAALSGIKDLNERYAGEGPDKFYFFHRERQFNESNNKWISWERKRGALIEFNNLVLGSQDTSFTYLSSHNPPFQQVSYIITLDCDTVLPIGMAKKMIGVLAHPLNKPVIDRQKNIVTDGYGIMQPRIEIDSESTNKSMFSKILTGQEGIDPYSNAISNVYQDLFGEGIFTGKGIYDLKAFHSILNEYIPLNAILSHDLLEGSFLRAGLVTDLKLVDSYPAKYNSYSARQHRWVRGDWQLLPFLFKKIRNSRNERTDNPLSMLSKLKIFDNLRRSLIAPSLIVLLALSFSILPGSMLFWFAFFVTAHSLSMIIEFARHIISGKIFAIKVKRYIPSITGLRAIILQNLLSFLFLPHQAWLMVNAITVTLIRVFITKKNMLEWVTSADAEKTQKNSLKSYIRLMGSAWIIALAVLALSIVFKPASVVFALFLFFVWWISPVVAFKISIEKTAKKYKPSEIDRTKLGRISRKTWRYFEEFSNFRNHFLAPDNYQADPPRGVAHRTSPTNIGLGLLATVSACDLGYVSVSEMVDLISKTVSTIEGLEKWNGHLYNWYDTISLNPLQPRYISTVDSGNLAGYLITLTQSLKDFLKMPVIDKRFIYGLRDTICCMEEEGAEACKDFKFPEILFDNKPLDLLLWKRAIHNIENEPWFNGTKEAVWRIKVSRTIKMYEKEISDYFSWIDLIERIPGCLRNRDPEDAVAAGVDSLFSILQKNSDLKELAGDYKSANYCIGNLLELLISEIDDKHDDAINWLIELRDSLLTATENIERLKREIEDLIGRVEILSCTMDFLPLYDAKRHLFSIGYNYEENKISNSYYDLFASEARQTSYICIAKGTIPPEHWFKMGRALTVVGRYKGLISWTGTMFEYLMPLLIMKTYSNTLLDETYSFVIKCQKIYAKQRKMPWGISESCFNSLDISNDYQYKAIGVPSLGLKRGLIEDAVAAPYATLLALAVEPEDALKNISLLRDEGLSGPYGFYEAADYTKERLPFETKRAVIKSFMAHHLGMSMLSLNNFLNNNIMQSRFFSDHEMNAAKLLLQEKIPDNLIFTKETKEKVIPLKGLGFKEISPVRRFTSPDLLLPKAHILSNGNYSVMITDKGTGYSKNKIIAVTRWRADSTIDKYGMFLYLRNVETNDLWSSTYAPLNILPEQYEVTFTEDKATFSRMDGHIKTLTEVIVTSGDNAEIRRLSIKNFGDKPCEIEVTSYLEVVIATQASDLAHPVFSNLFVETRYIAEKRLILASRRPRSDTEKSMFMANTAIVDGELVGNVRFETDRSNVIGRGHNVKNPIIIEPGKQLLNTVGPVLDPVICIRVTVRIEPGATATISYVTAISDSDEILLGMIEKYRSPNSIEGAFRLALASSQVETKYLGVKAEDVELYQNMISELLFISPRRMENSAWISKNTKGQSSLWRYGISGDYPIVFVVLNKMDRVKILNEVIKAREYWRLMDLHVDLVILSDEEQNYSQPLFNLVSDIVESSRASNGVKSTKGIYILDKNKVLEDDIALLYAVASIVLTGDGRKMAEQITELQPDDLPSNMQRIAPPSKYVNETSAENKLNYFNGIGGFSEEGNEYVIRLEKGKNTPAPWINVIANPGFGFIVSESGSGYTWYGNSRENKLTPWSNDAITDNPGEIIYISDTDTGEVWSLTCLPIREDTHYTITHGFGYSVFEHVSHGIKQRLSQHVPIDDSIKLSIASIKNTTGKKRNLTLTYFIRPILGVTDQVNAMHIKTSIGDTGTLRVENPYNEEYPGYICFIDSSQKGFTVTGDRKEFFGSGDVDSPECLSRVSLSGNVGIGYDPCAALQMKVALEPNESREIVFALGMASGIEGVEKLTEKYCDVKTAIESLVEVKDFWKNRLDSVQVVTPNVPMNLMLNGWLQYQVISCRLWARSAFYQSGGAYGFRDQLQDCLSVVQIWPQLVREQILRHASHQFLQGDVQHWWHEPKGSGTRTRISDDRLWLPYVTAEYIRVTGDSKILEEELAFLDDKILLESEDERYSIPEISENKATLYEHCLRAIKVSLNFGSHGLPLMGSGDWNDAMNNVGNRGSGESVWLAWFLASVLEMFSPICKMMGDDELVKEYAGIRLAIVEAVEKNAWDGNWYLRAYFDNGTPLGSTHNLDCRIDSISQSWSVISGAGKPERAVNAMNSMEEYLVSSEDGIIKLLKPPFDKGETEPGYIKGYIPGVRENGGQYTHAAAWAIIAFAKLGNGDKAWELFDLINPINHSNNLREYSRYKVEPYVMAADVYAVYPHIGRGGWSWYTGAAGWMYKAGLENIMGFSKKGKTIIIDPCIPKNWEGYSIKYKYNNSTYDIKVNNPQGINKGVKKISVDGKVSASNQIKLVNDGKTHDVDVLMG